jgi:prevent-host-death family protein
MATAGIRDLKNNLSRYLRRLRPGDSIAVTDRGRVIARLQAAPPDGPAGYAGLVARGLIRLASETGDPLAGWPSVTLPPGTAAALVAQDRGE